MQTQTGARALGGKVYSEGGSGDVFHVTRGYLKKKKRKKNAVGLAALHVSDMKPRKKEATFVSFV